MNDTAIIIVAGGSGTRMGATLPKQFLELSGKPLLMHTVERFSDALPGARLIVVLPVAQIGHWTALCEKHGFTVPVEVAAGGESRFASVARGLAAVGDAVFVGVHDGVRPLVSRELILSVLARGRRTGAAIPAVEVTDSLREIFPDGKSAVVDRGRYRAVQTPQFFGTGLLRRAYAAAGDGAAFTDDASVVEAWGHPVSLCPGDRRNLKITTSEDLDLAEIFLNGGK
ncbi:MAG: 2-C-methyl-D-erythritol 4-phosphate cytidylyltransferase [Rikenellaceae bacterium]|jgi:2-C-methyl-D-erythritol 4-phosphate cytidylyltransferase|nr:2-C-methyl-D-erythritol 4-phosphate cytidylyltransferase [Rikenellaceae bacterium]